MQISSSAPSKRPNRRRKLAATVTPVSADHRVILARRPYLLAGCELQHGHQLAAEHLTRRAQALREVGQ